MEKINKTKEEWAKKLTPEEYKILREQGTEAPFSGEYAESKKDGTYVCRGCDNKLFSSNTKYDSGSGWPSFYDFIEEGSVTLQPDSSLGAERTEVVCARCGSHLGHVFDDAPKNTSHGNTTTGKRYCINSLALNLKDDS